MTAQAALWSASAAALLLALIAGFAEHARSRRRNLDAPGWIPWTGVQIAAIFAGVVFAVLAFRA